MLKIIYLIIHDEGYGDHWPVAAYVGKWLAEKHVTEANKEWNCHRIQEIPIFRSYDEFLEQQ